MARPRILFPFASGAVSGTVTVAAALAGRLQGPFECRVALPADGPVAERFRSQGLDPHRYLLSDTVLSRVRHTPDLRSKLRALPAYGTLALAAWRELRTWRPDLLHASDNRTLLSWGLVARLMGIPVVWHVHQVRASRWLDRVRLALVRGVVVSTGAVRGRLGTRLPPALELPNPVDTRRFRPADPREARRRLGLDPDRLTLGFVGHLTARKRPEWAVRAFLRAAEAGVEAQMVLVGDPLEDPGLGRRLRAEAEAAGLGSRLHEVEVLREMEGVLPALDVLLLTSTRHGEALPMVVLEAMACGLAVLATDCGGVAEVVEDGETGLLVPAEDFEALVAGLERLAGSADLRDRMGRAARRRMEERRSLDAAAEDLGAFYRSLLA